MFQYEQSTGRLTHDDSLIGTGYSGNGVALNNPGMQSVSMHGPIPQGQYTIEPAITDTRTGPVSLHLLPSYTNNMFGRSAFLVHGDNSQMNHTASEGCIIMPREVRMIVASAVVAGDNQLTVVA